MGSEVKKVLCVCMCSLLLVVNNLPLSPTPPVLTTALLGHPSQFCHIPGWLGPGVKTPFHIPAVSPAALLLCGLLPSGEQDPIMGASRSSSFLVLWLWFAVFHSPLWGCWFQPLICHWVLCTVYNYIYHMYYTFMPGSEMDLILSELFTNTWILLMGTRKSF